MPLKRKFPSTLRIPQLLPKKFGRQREARARVVTRRRSPHTWQYMTMSDSRIPSRAALLEHDGWLRGLAKNLVSDPHSADDLVQETLLAAISRGPSRRGNLRGWLAGVLRNLALQKIRGEANRRAREEDSAQPEAPAADFDQEAIGLRRKLVECLDEIKEPYRTTLVLLYFEGWTPDRIANSQNVSVKTVYSRHERGLEHLRAKLDAQHGGKRDAWSVGVLTLLVPPRKPGHAMLRVGIVGAIGLVILIGIAVKGQPETPVDESAVSSRTAETESPSQSAATTPAFTAREEVSDASSVSESAALEENSIAAIPITGVVIDSQGNGLAGIDVVLEPGPVSISTERGIEFQPRQMAPPLPVATTKVDGTFEIRGALPTVMGRLGVNSESYVTVLHSLSSWKTRGSAIIIAAPRFPISGQVRSSEGEVIEGAVIRLRVPAQFGHALPAPRSELQNANQNSPFAVSDALGNFTFANAFRVDDAVLEVVAAGFDTQEFPIPDAPGAPMDLILKESSVEHLFGRVYSANLKPVEGALIGLGTKTVITGADGAFLIPAQPEFSNPILYATKRGHQPASARPEIDEHGNHVWPDPFELVLGGAPLTITGRVVDTEGEPVHDALIWIDDPTVLAYSTVPLLVEGQTDPTPINYWPNRRTNADGRFRINGLLDRDYRIGAIEKNLLVTTISDAVPAGSTDLSIVLDLKAVYPEIRGRALTMAGRPLSEVNIGGVYVVLNIDLPDKSLPFQVLTMQQVVRSNVDGEFELHPLSRNAKIRVHRGGPSDYAYDSYDVPVNESVLTEHFEILVPQSSWLTVRHGEADAFEVQNEAGHALELWFADEPSRQSVLRAPIAAGQSSRMIATEGLRTLVLFRGARELERRSVLLVAGEHLEIK